MSIEEAGRYALNLGELVTADQFTRGRFCWRVAGKWFMLTDLDVPEPQVPNHGTCRELFGENF